MIVAGVMSGTSADGINVALVRFPRNPALRRARGRHLPFELIGQLESPYPVPVRRTILQMMNATAASVAELARLNFLLGELYAEAVRRAASRFRAQPELVGCHGQTLYHQGEARPFLRRRLAVTWQTGEGAVLAARLNLPVVSDFRPADMATGGKGAPLVPFLDYMLFRDAHAGRVAQNIGGIANLTAIPPRALPEHVIAFDTGPGNMVIDAVMQQLFGKAYDRGGKIAAAGRILEPALQVTLRGKFFRKPPPKTAGREEFGREFVAEFLRRCGRARKEDVVATATALTAGSIAESLRRFVLKGSARYRDFIASGGGTRNQTLLKMLAAELAPLGLTIATSDDYGLPSQAKEAVAFALLAHQTWHRRPSNLPAATGAKRSAILGKISYA